MILAADGLPEVAGAGLVVLGLGTLLLILYVAARIGGRDLLPEGPPPEVPFKLPEVVAILVGSWLLQQSLLVLIVSTGMAAGTHALLLAYMGPIAVVLGVYELALRKRQEHGPRVKGAAAGLAASLASYPLVLVALIVWTLIFGWEEQGVLKRLREDPPTFFLIAVVLAPLTEEVLYRGLLYPALKGRFGKTLGLVLSAVLFAAAHVDVHVLAPLFVLGLVLAKVYERTGTLAAPIALHAAFNGFTFLGEMIKRAATG